MMTAAQLIEALQKLPPNKQVWLASDGECNSMNQIFQIDTVTSEEVSVLKLFEPRQYKDMPDEGVVLIIPV